MLNILTTAVGEITCVYICNLKKMSTITVQLDCLLEKDLIFFFFLQVYFFILSERKFLPTLQKILNFQLSYWCGNFVGTHGFRRVSGESRIARNSSQTVRLRKMFTTKNQVKLRHYIQCYQQLLYQFYIVLNKS